MTRAWETVARAESDAGPLELRRRGEDDFLITLAGRVLMNSRTARSETALAERGCAHLADRAGARVLVGGLGMGLTLRAALDALPRDAEVVVAELNPAVAEWCAGPLAAQNGAATGDARVRLVTGDVADAIAAAARDGGDARFDAILLDLYEGPHAGTDAQADPVYGRRALARTHGALRPGGVFAVWSEAPERGFEQRLRAAGFEIERTRPGRGGLRHAVTLARR